MSALSPLAQSGAFSPSSATPKIDNQDGLRLQNVVQIYLRDVRMIAAQQASLGSRKDQINQLVGLYRTPGSGMSEKEGQDAIKLLVPYYRAIEKTVGTAQQLFNLLDNALKEMTPTLMKREQRLLLTPQQLSSDASKRLQAATHDILDYLTYRRAVVGGMGEFLKGRTAVLKNDFIAAYYTFYPVSGLNPLNWFGASHFDDFLTANTTEALTENALRQPCPEPIESILVPIPETVQRAFQTLGVDPKTLDTLPIKAPLTEEHLEEKD